MALPILQQDPYLIAHNAILAHATAVSNYRAKYQAAQKGTIGKYSTVEYSTVPTCCILHPCME